MLLHIIDISHNNFIEHIESVNKIMTEIESIDKPTVMVFNKIDAYKAEPYDELDLINDRTEKNFSLEEWQKTWMAKMNGNCVFISATEKDNIQELKSKLYKVAAPIYAKRFPFNQFLY